MFQKIRIYWRGKWQVVSGKMEHQHLLGCEGSTYYVATDLDGNKIDAYFYIARQAS